MIGLAYLIAAGAYLWLTAKACGWAWRQGMTSGSRKRARLYALGMFMVMYHLVFWDVIPMQIMHSYYCHLDSGARVYMSADQWLAENKDQLDALKASKEEPADTVNGSLGRTKKKYIDHLNKAVVAQRTREPAFPAFLGIERSSLKIVDVRTNAVLIERIDYSAGKRILDETLRPQPHIQSCSSGRMIPLGELDKFDLR